MHSWSRILAATFCLSTMSPSVAQEVRLDVHHFLSPRAPAQAAFIEPWARRIEALSDGRITFDIYADMLLGGRPQQLYEDVVDGSVDIIWTVAGYTPGRFPRVEVFELPFVHENDAVATNLAIQDLYDPYLAPDFEEVHPLLIHVHAGQAFLSKEEPIRSLQDLRGRKVRIPSRTGAWMLEALGAKGVGMPVPSLPLALDKNIVDGAMIPQEIFPPLRLQNYIKTITVGADDMRFGTAVFIFAMNKDSYWALPPDLRQLIDDNSGAQLASEIGEVWMTSETKAHGFIESSGVEKIELSVEDTNLIRLATESVVDRWVGEMEQRGIDGRVLVQAAREAISRHR